MRVIYIYIYRIQINCNQTTRLNKSAHKEKSSYENFS